MVKRFFFSCNILKLIFIVYCRPNKQIWHGSNINGEKSIESFCGTWELASGEKFGMAGNLLHHRLINNEKVWCKSDLIILCIETIPKEGVPLT